MYEINLKTVCMRCVVCTSLAVEKLVDVSVFISARVDVNLYRPTKSHALGVILTHLMVISRSHAY